MKNILYLWTGKQCTAETALQGEVVAEEYGCHLRQNVMHIRVYENMEPPHFLQTFKGKLIVFKGKCIDFDSRGSCCVYPNTYLLKVIGNATHNSKAIQVSSKIVDFTAHDCFIIRTADGSNWIWCGPSSTGRLKALYFKKNGLKPCRNVEKWKIKWNEKMLELLSALSLRNFAQNSIYP